MRHFAFTDIHGMEKLFDKVLSTIKEKSGEEEFHIYFLGDAADRGAKGYKIIKKILDDSNITYIYGNHEDLFVKAARSMEDIAKKEHFNDMREFFTACVSTNTLEQLSNSIALFLYNGGLPTLREWVKDSPLRRSWVLSQIENLPRYTTYKNIDMCHAGCFQADWKINEEEMLWCRTHLNEPWFEGRILVHGHTPVSKPSTVYANSTKINLDSGACRTGVSRVMDLDSKELFYVTL